MVILSSFRMLLKDFQFSCNPILVLLTQCFPNCGPWIPTGCTGPPNEIPPRMLQYLFYQFCICYAFNFLCTIIVYCSFYSSGCYYTKRHLFYFTLYYGVTGVVGCILIHLFVYLLEQQSGSLHASLPLYCTMHLQR